MPAKTEKQRKFMGAELQRKREGKETKTDMSEKELEKMASKGDKKDRTEPAASAGCRARPRPSGWPEKARRQAHGQVGIRHRADDPVDDAAALQDNQRGMLIAGATDEFCGPAASQWTSTPAAMTRGAPP